MSILCKKISKYSSMEQMFSSIFRFRVITFFSSFYFNFASVNRIVYAVMDIKGCHLLLADAVSAYIRLVAMMSAAEIDLRLRPLTRHGFRSLRR